MKTATLDDIANVCIRRGFFFPSGKIYGGLSGFYDYGPLGVELRYEIVNNWWNFFVRNREDIVGIYGSIITHPETWNASGHTESFIDFIVKCTKCGSEFRADHLLEEKGVKITDLTIDTFEKLIHKYNVKCPVCGGKLSKPEPFNLMFETYIGPKKTKANIGYLRPETAQLIFTNFKNIYVSMRLKLPFGVAQIGKAFRNEISPRNFLFRIREFEQMEIEYFINPNKLDDCPFFKEIENMKINLLPAEFQEQNKEDFLKISLGDAFRNKYITTKWHAYWIGKSIEWLIKIGLNSEKIRVREHIKTELAHYAIQTFDIEYLFPEMGWKEIEGISNRGNYDLLRHQKYSGKDLTILDENEKVIPYVIEPSFGLERIILAILIDSYREIENRRILSLKPIIAPIKVGVYPLMKKPDLIKKARKVYFLLKKEVNAFYDESGSIGKRYARADEIGVPFGVTIDKQTLEDNTVTIRFRDTKEQIRIDIDNLVKEIKKLLES